MAESASTTTHDMMMLTFRNMDSFFFPPGSLNLDLECTTGRGGLRSSASETIRTVRRNLNGQHSPDGSVERNAQDSPRRNFDDVGREIERSYNEGNLDLVAYRRFHAQLENIPSSLLRHDSNSVS
ncbi:hypothetical protein EMMF5_003335 [Cystobasidiomycetes sp. EMM_F5]